MAGQSKIRWSDKDERELKRLVKNFNAKVKRLEEKEPYLKDARPDKLSYREIKKQITTRSDFKRNIASLDRFTKRGSEAIRTTKAGVATTEYAYKEASIMQRAVTRKRRAKRSVDWKRDESQSLFDKAKPDSITNNFKKYMQSLEKEVASNFDNDRKESFRNNYTKAIIDNMGFYGKAIVDYVNQLDLDTFVNNALTNPFLSIDFTYSDIEKQERAEQILGEWKRVT